LVDNSAVAPAAPDAAPPEVTPLEGAPPADEPLWPPPVAWYSAASKARSAFTRLCASAVFVVPVVAVPVPAAVEVPVDVPVAVLGAVSPSSLLSVSSKAVRIGPVVLGDVPDAPAGRDVWVAVAVFKELASADW
jgi:hypothetical protein